MTDYTITISDQQSLDGITWATARYNASLPIVLDDKGNPVTPTPGTLDEAGYVSMVMVNAAASYGAQKQDADLADAIAAAKAGDASKLETVATDIASKAVVINPKPLPPQPMPVQPA